MKKLLLITATVFQIQICNAQSVTDIDSNIYQTVTIGTQVWMKENLRNKHAIDGSILQGVYAYNNDESNVSIYGRLYTYASALKACPAGWHLPSDKEWQQLEKFLGMPDAELTQTALKRGESANVGGKLKSEGTSLWNAPNTGATDETGFSAIPHGTKSIDGTYNDMGMVCEYWTSTADGSTNAFDHGLGSYLGGVARFSINRSFGIGVRCIKDIPSGTNESRNEGFEIFPNPTTGRLALSFGSNSLQQAQTEVYNTQGQMVFSKTFQNTSSIEFDISLFPKGLYVVKVWADGIHYESKVCLQ